MSTFGMIVSGVQMFILEREKWAELDYDGLNFVSIFVLFSIRCCVTERVREGMRHVTLVVRKSPYQKSMTCLWFASAALAPHVCMFTLGGGAGGGGTQPLYASRSCLRVCARE
jgi:hypothetical protein